MKEGENVSLFGGDHPGYSKNQKTKITASELGGGAVGAGAGLLTRHALNVNYRNELLDKGNRISRDKELASQNWTVLLDLTRGKISLEDFPSEQRDFYAKKLVENADDLNYFKHNPSEAKKALSELEAGKVQPLFSNQQQPSKLKSFLDSFKRKQVVLGKNVEPLFTGKQEYKMFFPHEIENPQFRAISPFLGMAGMVGTGMLMKRHYDKANQSNQQNNDLEKLHTLLQQLKGKEYQSNG
jgi:hypothetical protein